MNKYKKHTLNSVFIICPVFYMLRKLSSHKSLVLRAFLGGEAVTCLIAAISHR